MKRAIIIILVCFLALILLIAGGGYFLIATEKGSGLLARAVINRVVKADDINIDDFDGTLSEGIVMENAVFENLEGLPAGSVLMIQKLTAKIQPFDVMSSTVKIENARLHLPLSEAIMVFGTYENGALDINVYSNAIDAAEIVKFLKSRGQDLPAITGTLNDADFYIKGPLDNIVIDGKLLIKTIVYRDFQLKDAPVTVALQLPKQQGTYDPRGILKIDKGTVFARKTSLKLTESSVVLSSGEPKTPLLDIRGTTTIDGIEITANLQGTPKEPQISVSSVPPFSKPKILLMLATGQSWQGVETAIQEQQLSTDAMADVLGYMFFGGQGESLAGRLGFKDIKILFDDETRGIGFTRALTSGIDVGYQITQEASPAEPSQVKQKLESDLKLNKNISISVEREVKQYQGTGTVDTNQQTDDRIFLEYKKKF